VDLSASECGPVTTVANTVIEFWAGVVWLRVCRLEHLCMIRFYAVGTLTSE
jgi:hypothetical protein